MRFVCRWTRTELCDGQSWGEGEVDGTRMGRGEETATDMDDWGDTKGPGSGTQPGLWLSTGEEALPRWQRFSETAPPARPRVRARPASRARAPARRRPGVHGARLSLCCSRLQSSRNYYGVLVRARIRPR